MRQFFLVLVIIGGMLGGLIGWQNTKRQLEEYQRCVETSKSFFELDFHASVRDRFWAWRPWYVAKSAMYGAVSGGAIAGACWLVAWGFGRVFKRGGDLPPGEEDERVTWLIDERKYDEAEPLAKRAVDAALRNKGPDHPDTAESLHNLATVYKLQGRYAASEPLFKRALSIYEKALGQNQPDTAACLGNLAVLYQAQAKYDDAEPLFEQALAIFEDVLGPDSPEACAVRDDLALMQEERRATGSGTVSASQDAASTSVPAIQRPNSSG